MMFLRLSIASSLLAVSLWADGAVVQPPSYSAPGVVNAASFTADALAPNAIASLFGTNLSYSTKAVGAADLVSGGLPTTLAGVTIYVGGIAAGLYYVSPNQINFLLPNVLLPGPVKVYVAREGVAGPHVVVTLATTGPELFQDSSRQAIATHLDGSLISESAAAKPGEWIVLYGVGLGRTVPDAQSYELEIGIAPLQAMSSFGVLLDGQPLDKDGVYYAGLAPGFAGLYQMNVKLPANVSKRPEIQITTGIATSIPSVWIAVD